jgi:hypothetical protein
VLVGYMRVSKADGSQTTELQRDALHAACVGPAHLYNDQASGRRDDRPGLAAACLKALRDGDTLVVRKLDRLGRNTPPSRQHRPRPHRTRSRTQGAHGAGRRDRHDHATGEARIRDLRRAGRV